ncbi:MAG: tRNA uridine-5-carboxymethylaminomethyl(34) synthesis GTPase MnmE [Pyrinomonadaceae bacterium]
MPHRNDTIIALSTPQGRSAIGVIRLSGSHALEIARTLLADAGFAPDANHASLRKLLDPDTKEVLDHALITYFKAPRSFTGEDVIELSCHGSPAILRWVIDIALRLDARLAEPGEFTLRALANGRVSLSQAEAVRDLIDAQTNAAVRQATRQLGGELSLRLQPFKDKLLEIIVPLESSLEFVEDDLPEVRSRQIISQLSDLVHDIEKLSATYRAGHLLREGLKVTLVGRPNVGKSSIFNTLLLNDRAIVAATPGTTRDSISESINIEGIPVLLTDTAGVRESTDEVESLGVGRTRQAMIDADLNVIVLDGSQPCTTKDLDVIKEVVDLPHIIAFNKSDIGSFANNTQVCLCDKKHDPLVVSAKTGEGFDALRTALISPFITGINQDTGLLITDARHFDLLRRTQTALSSSIGLLEQRASEELILVWLYNALRLLGEITGETTPEDVLTQIFATFCIGK